jgi:hypothetical protein
LEFVRLVGLGLGGWFAYNAMVFQKHCNGACLRCEGHTDDCF